MKPLYRIFTRAVTNFIPILFVLFTIVWSTLMVIDAKSGVTFRVLSVTFLFVPFSVYFLKRTILPIIKIDDYGVRAYSVFWKRTLPWDKIRSAKIFTNDPLDRSWEEFDATAKQSYSIKLFIFISEDRKLTLPVKLRYTLFSHNQIASKGTIAFAYDDLAWKFINEKLVVNATVKK